MERRIAGMAKMKKIVQRVLRRENAFQPRWNAMVVASQTTRLVHRMSRILIHRRSTANTTSSNAATARSAWTGSWSATSTRTVPTAPTRVPCATRFAASRQSSCVHREVASSPVGDAMGTQIVSTALTKRIARTERVTWAHINAEAVSAWTSNGAATVSPTVSMALMKSAARTRSLMTKCNNKDECPGATDEQHCMLCGKMGLFECKQEQRCVSRKVVCNHNKDCIDGSDETPEACKLVNRTSHAFLPAPYPPAECHHGFLCRTGQCIEWREVCDQTPDCFDGSDENGQCFTACENTTCGDVCQATPVGPKCTCNPGYYLLPDGQNCGDVDECSRDHCSHLCVNFPGSFLCECRHGYSLRADRRSCKLNINAINSYLFASGHSVRSISDLGGRHYVEFDDASLGTLADIDVNFAKQKIYVTSPETGKLIELTPLPTLNGTSRNVFSNIGKPTKMTADWVTGNVYFVDNSSEPSIKVCNFKRKRCARLKSLPGNGTVSSLVVSLERRKLFYSINYNTTCEVISLDLSGTNELKSQFSGASLAMAVDGPELYVARDAEIWNVDPGHSFKIKSKGDWHRFFPQAMHVFDDYIYVLRNHTLIRCAAFHIQFCISFIVKLPDTQAFVIWHPSIQRKLKNECDGYVCENVCVLSQEGPTCICEDGNVAKDGKCALLGNNLVPLFNGVPARELTQESHLSVIIPVIFTVFVILGYLAIILYYHFVYRPRKAASAAQPVRFQNQSSIDGSIQAATVEIQTTSGSRHEFVNKMDDYVRDIWRNSVKRKRPIGTAGKSSDMPKPVEDLSDTESDIDGRDERVLIK